ncbi:MAG: hypothetical protein JXC36_09555 [Candidatus Atribacteria bacterium]|nr:hypothetical protein [Candidatus Atribacteria bacterium]
MLNLSQAGGGCTINLTVHFIDFIFCLVKEEIKTVYTALSNLIHHEDIEDFSSVILRTNDGITCIIETGYAYPNVTKKQRDIYYSIIFNNNYLTVQDEKITWIEDKLIKENNIITNTDKYYPIFIREVLNATIKEEKPKASLRDMYKAMKVIDAIYKSRRKRKVIDLI